MQEASAFSPTFARTSKVMSELGAAPRARRSPGTERAPVGLTEIVPHLGPRQR